jgi:hypothetical protein
MFVGVTHASVRTACRGDAVRRPGTVVHAGPTSPNTSARVQRPPPGDPPGRPYITRRQGAGRWSERTESCRLFPPKQQRDASPWQGEAGAERRVRVDPAVHVGATRCVALVRSCTTAPHHPGCPPATAPRTTHRVAPTLPGGRVQVGGASGQKAAVCSQRSNKETPLPGRERPARSAG